MLSSGSFSESSKANMCLMEKEESASNTLSSNLSINNENYFQFLEPFKKTHEEASRLTLLNN